MERETRVARTWLNTTVFSYLSNEQIIFSITHYSSRTIVAKILVVNLTTSEENRKLIKINIARCDVAATAFQPSSRLPVSRALYGTQDVRRESRGRGITPPIFKITVQGSTTGRAKCRVQLTRESSCQKEAFRR
ncbi:hypothetical protein NDU88_007538 [Pleurodeles waltl]|uniref:Uncharacterized protein n=1 Tax=Pleurodeles waltl TaxID=8319 RepID=A0AAV7PPL1_PLEWA|nr:hypothetical protein NDU88_007538 [Pleurodeles waltl]